MTQSSTPPPDGTILRPAGPPEQMDGRVVLIDDDRLRSVLDPDAPLLRLFDGAHWSEGPAWLPEPAGLVWSSIKSRQLLRWHANEDELGMVTVWQAQTEFNNGNAVDADNRLIHCEHGRRCVSRTESDGTNQVLADNYDGQRLNSPNDVILASDGVIWFTDPTFGITYDDQGYPTSPDLDHRSLYRIDPGTGTLQRMADFDEPNGLAFSPDERVLYVSDTSRDYGPGGTHHIYAFDVEPGPKLTGRREFAVIEPGIPDGFVTDQRGWIWTSSGNGAQIFHPDGTRLGQIVVPNVCANVTFGGPPFANRLFMGSENNLYAVDLSV